MTVPLLATVSLPSTTGLPEDAATNDYAFLAADTSDATLDGITASLVALYNAGPVNAIGTYISGTRSRVSSACQIDYYNLTGHLDGSPHGSPIRTDLWTLTPAASGHSNLPDEVALKVTFLAAGWESVPEISPNPTPPPATLRLRGRYRGGVYLGPWIVEAMGTVTTTNTPRPSATVVGYMATAFATFQDERPDWAVWSRADADLKPMAVGGDSGIVWCDNAWDTQRRRGPAATSRTILWP